ncbi:M56 family metallopeptidase [Winogradskyella tangerina]|uniref:M56 family metallopeptidase n=1 Tax=Winogradskyella tangerina TaxID=2023240 RepID=UPI0018E4ECEF|nr:M56 family metallopeptidase [Winogradskyella tangerina]
MYVLKFSACLFVLWLVYWLLLEKQNSHKFKRFYLLGAIAAALIIPLLTITNYVEPVVSELEVAPTFVPTEYMYVEAPIEEVNPINAVDILWVIYWIGAAIFLTRFIVNLGRLYYKISSNATVTSNSFIYVLLKNYRIPHSFFKYIFLNKQRYEDQSIPEEVILHEQTHARQLHSIDIVVLELLQVVLWFHPLIYILKHHVRLNHEFLADEAVINQGTDAKNYQNILLQFSSSTQQHQLASAINYSSFKKRFTVMKTQTSKTKKWLSALLLLPVIAILFYSFAEHVEVVKSEVPNDFLVTVEKNNNTIELRCETGCKWSHITLEPQAKPYIINDYGFTDGATIDSDKFAFTIEPTDIGVELNGLTGTAWIDLAFSLRDHKVQAINQLGMTKISKDRSKMNQQSETLGQRAIKNYYTKLFFKIEDSNGEIVKKRFNELSYEDKVKWVYSGVIPYNRIDVTEAHFDEIKTSKDIIAKVDGNYISDEELEKYKASDFITFRYTTISELAGMKETSVVNLVTPAAYDAFVNIMINQYEEVIADYEDELALPENNRTKDIKELVSIYEFLNYNFNQFTSEIIEKNNFKSPTPIPANVIYEVHQSYLKIPTLYIGINDNLYLNGAETSLRTIQQDFNEITNYQKSELILEADGRKIENSFINEIAIALGDNLKNISVANGQALIYDPDFINEGTLQNDPIKNYLKKYEVYKKLQDTPPHYIKKSKEDQEKMDKLFSELGGMYFRMSKANKAKVNRPVAPVHPYVKITLKGKTYYKKYEELTKEERATLPPPPPPPPVKKSKGGPNADYDQNEVYNPTFLEYIIEMEALNTTFYLDNKMISSEEAKNIAQNNKGMHTDMLTQKDTNGNFVVKLSSPQQIDVQKGASKEQIKAYNAWAKKINAAMEKAIKNKDANDYPIIKLKEFEKYKHLYDSVMTDAQRKSAVPFPDKLPPPPPRPESEKNNYKKIKSKLNSKSKGGPNSDSYNGIVHNNSNLKKTYQKKYREYERMRYAKPHYLKKSNSDKKKMSELWVELRQMYFYSMSEKEKKDLKLPLTPFAPYVKILKDGKSYYKVNKYLTKEEQKVSLIINDETNDYPGLDLLGKDDPIVIPIGTYKLEAPEKNDTQRRKVFISISEDGTYKISKDNTLKNFEPLTIQSLEGLIANLSLKDKANTFVFAKKRDFNKFRSKPANSSEYQDDIEVILIKDEIKFIVSEVKGKFKEQTVYQLALENDASETIKSHVEKIGELFRKYKITNITI